MAEERAQTVTLTDDEWRIVHAALRAYLQDFGHDEADVVAIIRSALSKVPTGERFFET